MKRFKNILLVTDLQAKNKSALNRAVSLAERNNSKLTIVDIVEEAPGIFQKILSKTKKDKIERKLISEKKRRLKQEVSLLKKRVPTVTCDILRGTGFVEVIRRVKKNKHDLVIIPPQGRVRIHDHVFGSTTMHLMRKCPCPVWVVKSSRKKKYFRILAAVNLSDYQTKIDPLNIKIMELATSLAQWDECKLDVVFAWHLFSERFLRDLKPAERARLRKEAQKEFELKMHMLTEKFKQEGFDIKVKVKEGKAYHVISETVKKSSIDLIVMGTLARTGIAGLLIGNTAEETLQQVECSVLTIKPDDFITPIN